MELPNTDVRFHHPMAVEVLTTSLGRVDCFLEDIFKVCLALLDIINKSAASVPLAIYVSMRPLAEDEPVPRKETLSIPKLLLEQTPKELMMVLGWWIDTRQLLLHVPKHKFDWWSEECVTLLVDPKITRAALESLIGKLVQAAYVVPLARHFLSQLQSQLA